MKFSVYESEVYQEFRELRGPSESVMNRKGLTLAEWAEWDEKQKNYLEVKDILVFLAANLRRASNRGDESHRIEVDLDYVYDVGASQDFLCALTGEELEFTRGGQTWLGKWCNPNSCTIDRIDSSKGYVKDNIQLITWKANCLKQHLDNEEFIDFCKNVAHWNR